MVKVYRECKNKDTVKENQFAICFLIFHNYIWENDVSFSIFLSFFQLGTTDTLYMNMQMHICAITHSIIYICTNLYWFILS